ncbi:MAG: M23 family metallopeptidase [Myxococcota bacterium]|nr:M23 family metallopeptidase [Myxococcota bacterium]
MRLGSQSKESTQKVRPPPPGFTVMIIPQRGKGAVRQLTLSRRSLHRLFGGAGVMVLLLGVGLLAGVTGPLGYGPVVEENLALKAHLSELEMAVTEAEQALEQMRIHRTELDAISGAGPLDAADMAASGRVAEAPRAVLPGELAPPMDDDSGTLTEADALLSRTERLLVTLRLAEPAMAHQVNAERIRRQTMPSIWPARGLLSSGYGMRRSPVTWRYKMHSGIDIAAPRGTPIIASGAGEVVLSEYHAGYGNLIEIEHSDGIVSRYAHCSRRLVAVGEDVLRGDLIATVGSTGQSTGPHLHYEILIDGDFVDPMEFIEN